MMANVICLFYDHSITAKDEAGDDISLKNPENTTHSDKLVGGAGSAKA
jgi:hypothetical protein